MPWVRIDDQFPDHPKVVAAGQAAAWLYVTGLCYCNRMLTDGFIPADQVARLVPYGAKLAPKLVEVGLWTVTTRQDAEGYDVHDYHEYQPTREQVLAERHKNAERQKRARERAAAKRTRNGKSNGVSNAVSH
jgi:hypothetical protein